MRYFIHLSYDGTAYRGWQRQPDVISVQEILEEKLQLMLHQKTTCIGCGRTDAGVHASQYFCHIDVTQAIDFDPVFRLNKMLPNDIAIYDFIPVADAAHARFDAKERTYEYFLHFYKHPFLQYYSAYYDLKNLNLEAMKKATALLLEYQDFRSLCKRPDLNKHTLCDIRKARLFIEPKAGSLRLQISANRFLQAMIRLIVAQLLEVGRNKLSVEGFELLLSEQVPIKYFTQAYPQGLYLSKIEYPDLAIAPQKFFLTEEQDWQLL